ncbi:hypothetical protein GCM10022294_15480 [Dietzia aurantiaca]
MTNATWVVSTPTAARPRMPSSAGTKPRAPAGRRDAEPVILCSVTGRHEPVIGAAGPTPPDVATRGPAAGTADSARCRTRRRTDPRTLSLAFVTAVRTEAVRGSTSPRATAARRVETPAATAPPATMIRAAATDLMDSPGAVKGTTAKCDDASARAPSQAARHIRRSLTPVLVPPAATR